jgi:cold shock CspA family protein
MQSGLRSGKLTKWKDERGFGFIQPVDGSQEVFLHISEVKDATRRPQENDTIYGVVRQKDESSRNAGNRNILKLEVMNKKPN